MTDTITTDKEALNELCQWVTRLSIDKSMVNACGGLLQEYCRNNFDKGGQLDCTPSDLLAMSSMLEKLYDDIGDIDKSISKVMHYLDREFYESYKKPDKD